MCIRDSLATERLFVRMPKRRTAGTLVSSLAGGKTGQYFATHLGDESHIGRHNDSSSNMSFAESALLTVRPRRSIRRRDGGDTDTVSPSTEASG